MDYFKHYEVLIARAIGRGKLLEYVERHRIVPGCMGGKYVKENIAWLTPEEHLTAHLLLVKMYPDHEGLAHGANAMCADAHGNRLNNKSYGWVRKKLAAASSKRMKEYLKHNPNPSTLPEVKAKRREAWLGEKNPSYGNPNWKSIEAAAKAKKGTRQTEDHNAKISESIKRWHAENKDKHPMKNPETLAKAVASRKATAERKKLEKEKLNG